MRSALRPVRTGALRRAIEARPAGGALLGSAVKYAAEQEREASRTRLLGREESPRPSEEPDFCEFGCYWECEHRDGVASGGEQSFLARYAQPLDPDSDMRATLDFYRDQLLRAVRADFPTSGPSGLPPAPPRRGVRGL